MPWIPELREEKDREKKRSRGGGKKRRKSSNGEGKGWSFDYIWGVRKIDAALYPKHRLNNAENISSKLGGKRGEDGRWEHWEGRWKMGVDTGSGIDAKILYAYIIFKPLFFN